MPGGSRRWMVAVRMVSEGVGVPRLCVAVHATSTSTPLFFAQAVGRVVRARRRGETASVLLPSVPVILEHAARLEDERDHALDRVRDEDSATSMWGAEEALIAEANRAHNNVGLEDAQFEALESDAHFDHVLFDARQFGLHAEVGSEEEQDYLRLPGLLEPDQVAALLHERQARHAARAPRHTVEPLAAHRALAAQRKELDKRSRRTRAGPAPPTRTCTWTSAAAVAAPQWRRPPPSRSPLVSTRSGSGSWAAVEAIGALGVIGVMAAGRGRV